jgi:hypothetical protein
MGRAFVVLLLCCAGAPVIACVYPAAAPEIPDGKTATREQMLAAQEAVKDYVAKMEAYVSCLDEAVVALGTQITQAEQHVYAQKQQAAEDAKLAIADRYNVEVRAYKDAHEDRS